MLHQQVNIQLQVLARLQHVAKVDLLPAADRKSLLL
jgi:hypothetical protein